MSLNNSNHHKSSASSPRTCSSPSSVSSSSAGRGGTSWRKSRYTTTTTTAASADDDGLNHHNNHTNQWKKRYERVIQQQQPLSSNPSEMNYHHRQEEEGNTSNTNTSTNNRNPTMDTMMMDTAVTDDYMDDILAPSFEMMSDPTATSPPLNTKPSMTDSMDSADSIIRRVEDEIANARMNARNAQQQTNTQRVLSEEEDDRHLHTILNITMSSQDFTEIEEQQHQYPLKSSISSDFLGGIDDDDDDDGDSSSSHHSQVLDLIRDEFSTTEEKKTEEQPTTTTMKVVVEKQHLTDEEEETTKKVGGDSNPTIRQSPPATPNRNYRRNNHQRLVQQQQQNNNRKSPTMSPREPEGNYYFQNNNNNNTQHNMTNEPPPSPPPPSFSTNHEGGPPSSQTTATTPRRHRGLPNQPRAQPQQRSSPASSPNAAAARTRELLDSLRQQRESIRPNNNNHPTTTKDSPSRNKWNNNSNNITKPPSPSSLSTPSNPTTMENSNNNNNIDDNQNNNDNSNRQPSYRFTRATHAKQRVKALSNHYNHHRRLNVPELTTTTDPEPDLGIPPETSATNIEEPNTRMSPRMSPRARRTPPESTTTTLSSSSVMMMKKKRASPRRSPDRQVVIMEPTSTPEKSSTTTTQVLPESKMELETSNSSVVVDKENNTNSHVLDDFMQKIRFRNPFPVIKSPPPRRDADAIIADHTVPLPDVPIRWVKPKKELKQLIVAAMGTSLPRRSNACGALKVLTRVQRNQLTLARTDGFLSAIIFAASQSIVNDNNNNNHGDGDVDNIALAVDARTRAVACIMNVCNPKDNRILVMSHPGLVECLVKVLEVDNGEARALAAGALALLAKTPACREAMIQVDGIIDILAQVMHRAASMESEEAKAIKNAPSMQSTLTGDDEHDDDHASELSEHTNDDDHHHSDNDDEDDDYASARGESSSHSSLENSPSSKHNKSPEIKPDIRAVDSLRARMEERKGEFIEQARSNTCAALLHMSKQCAIAPVLCSNDTFLYSVVAVAQETSNPIHTKCLEIICNLTRFPANNAILARYNGLVNMLLSSCNSSVPEGRLSALRSLQNMSADPASKALLATSPVLTLMTSCAMRKVPSEKEVAVAVLCNIATEPSAVTAITNTKNVVATLVHLAHSPDSSSSVRLLACDGLATISLWLQTLAGTGKVPTGMPNVLLPSQQASHWERWD